MTEKGIPGRKIYSLVTIYSGCCGRQIAFSVQIKMNDFYPSVVEIGQKLLSDFWGCPKAAVLRTQSKTANSY